MRMRDQLIVIIAVMFATVAVGVNVFAQTQAEDHRAENQRIAEAASWAQPIVVSTTSAPDTTLAGTDKTDPPVQAGNGVSRAPGQNPEDCTPPGQADRDKDKNTPPGQDREDMCVPPGQDKDKDTPPGQVDRVEDKNVPPGQDKNDNETPAPPGQDKKDNETPAPPGQDKKDKD